MRGAVESQVQFAKANQSVVPKLTPIAGVDPGPAAHTNCCGLAQSVGVATAMLSSHVHSMPSLFWQRPRMGIVPDAHALHRNAPGRAQSQMLRMPESSSFGPASADPAPRNGAALSVEPHPIEAPITMIV
jgi:hypothetical protein